MSQNELRDEASQITVLKGVERSPLLPSGDTQAITQSDKVWFADGNVILQTSTKRYRVHGSVLATHSSVFKDMLYLPQPIEQPEVFDGCPVVHLTDLTEDWDELLPLFYNTIDLRDEYGFIDLHLMVAMLRLGNKYGCDRFKAQALRQLRRAFPSNFYGCQCLSDGSAWGASSLEELVMENEFYLLDVALELGIETVLPFAFFSCLENCTMVQILAGTYDAGPARAGTLRLQTRETLLRANDKIIGDISEKIYAWWKQAKPSSKCTTKDACTNAISKAAVKMIGIPTVREVFVPRVSIRGTKGLCQVCMDHGESSANDSRRQIFDKLPTYFGLRGWTDLKDFEI